jgi:pimeloyl-ACP methyl ester carboxylesterase
VFCRARPDVERFMGCSPDDDPEAYALTNPMALLPLGCRQLLVTGDNDVNVPAELTRKYAEAAERAGDPTVLLEIPTAECAPVPDHFAVITPTHRIWERIALAMAELLPTVDEKRARM